MSETAAPAQRTAPASPIIPGIFVKQGEAIQARLQVAFTPAWCHFEVLPPRLTRNVWDKITQGNQPFLGLGFNGFKPTGSLGKPLMGEVSWTVITAIRRNSATHMGRYYGDKYGIGALTMAEVAAALLTGYGAPGGTVKVVAIANVAADDWGEDSVIMKIDLLIPVKLRLGDEILAPEGLGWFDVLATTWGWSAQDGTHASFNSEWDNPNAQPSD